MIFAESLQQRYQNDVNGFILVCLSLTLKRFHTLFGVSIVDFEQVNTGWVAYMLDSFFCRLLVSRFFSCHFGYQSIDSVDGVLTEWLVKRNAEIFQCNNLVFSLMQ